MRRMTRPYIAAISVSGLSDCPACNGSGGVLEADESGPSWCGCYVCEQRGTFANRKQVLRSFEEARDLMKSPCEELRTLLALYRNRKLVRKS